jgi:hypothetical protein
MNAVVDGTARHRVTCMEEFASFGDAERRVGLETDAVADTPRYSWLEWPALHRYGRQH